MSPRERLKALFLPTRRLGGPEPQVLHAGGALGPVQWVVPRAQCHYRRFDFDGLPPRQRAGAAAVAVRRLDPAPGARHHVAWVGTTAHAWVWPQPDPAMAGEEAQWIPESRLRPAAAGDGARLVAMLEGVEGQVWRDGQLKASHWWPQVPDAGAWQRFLRAAGLAPAGEGVPPALALAFSREPWGDRPAGLPGSPAALERLAWVAGIGLVALGLGWQLAAQAEWRFSQARLEQRLEALRAQATPLLEARERADAALLQLQAYHGLARSESDHALMAEVVEPLAADARLVFWQREADRLQVGVASADTDPRRYVAAFQGHPRLADVVANPLDGGKGMRLDFTLAPAAGSSPP